MKTLNVGGFVPFTTIDFPGVSAACVVFCQGCPWRCPYCQNEELQPLTNAAGATRWSRILSKIRTRQAFLEGVVFSGGEPLAQVELKRAIEDVKRLGFRVGLHTGGAYPERLKELVAGTKETDLPLVDWVGLDVKTGFSNYDLLTGVSGSADAVVKSLDILLESRVDLECRTTVHPAFVQPEHIFEIAEFLSQRGVRVYKLQRCYDTNRAPMPSPCFEAEFLKSIQRIYPDVAERLF